MERFLLRGFLYLVLVFSCLAFVFPGSSEGRAQAEKEAGFMVVLTVAALAISARVPKMTAWEWLSEKPKGA